MKHRLLLLKTLVALMAIPIGQTVTAGEYDRPVLSFYGTPGYIDNPSGVPLPDADIALSTALFHGIIRNTATFQISPRLTGSFRYSVHGVAIGQGENFDRSFDISLLVLDESEYLPGVAIGMRDFVGTSRYSGEFIAATKHLTDTLTVTGGVGWGRLGGNTRPHVGGGGAIISYRNWFSGPVAAFAGVEWNVNDRLSLVAEYSQDDYAHEAALYGFERKSPFNFGLNYRTEKGWDLGLYYLYGSHIGFKASYILNPRTPRTLGGQEGAPPLVGHRSGVAESWGLTWASDQNETKDIRATLRSQLARQGVRLQAADLAATRATIWVQNDRFGAVAQAIGRTARIMSQVLPASVEDLTIVTMASGIPVSAITLKRSDLEALEWRSDATSQSRMRADIADGAQFTPSPEMRVNTADGDLKFNIGWYLSASLFDPDAPIRADLGVQVDASYSPTPAVTFSASIRQPLFGNLSDNTRVSDSVLPHVRSDAAEYDRQSGLELSHLTVEYLFRPAENLFARVTAGYLERMYGGVSAELLWKPVDSNLALGAEINFVRQRDFDVGFGFQDYAITTGHASLYYQFGNGYHTQIDVGRYLAGDWGATFKFERRFANDWRVGLFFTLTDVPFETFGEGAFDKGLYFQIPHEWLTGEPSRAGFAQSIHLIGRDGGARVDVRNRLYEVVSDFQDPRLSQRWGRFWR